jgi:hypothetical protein
MTSALKDLGGSPSGLNFTRYLFAADAIINWVIGAACLIFPRTVLQLLFTAVILSPIWLRFLGGGFLAFALWQTAMVARDRVANPTVMGFAAWMAVLPAIILGGSLLLLPLPLRPASRALLWIGEAYMLLLSAWYAVVHLGLRSSGRAG